MSDWSDTRHCFEVARRLPAGEPMGMTQDEILELEDSLTVTVYNTIAGHEIVRIPSDWMEEQTWPR